MLDKKNKIKTSGSDPWEERKQDLNGKPGPGSQLCLSRFQIHRDPRFDDLSGVYNPEVFMKTYSFLDAIKKQEKEVMLYACPWPGEPCLAGAASAKAFRSGAGRQAVTQLSALFSR